MSSRAKYSETEQIAIRVPHDILSAFRSQAEASGRSLSAVVIDVMRAHLGIPDRAGEPTRSDLIRAGQAAARAKGSHPGRPLSTHRYDEIRPLVDLGWGLQRIAEALGVSRSVVRRVRDGTS